MKKNRGQTLTELLIVISIISLSVYLVLPFGSQFLRRNELDNRTNLISNAVNFARNQSIILGENLILSQLDNETHWQSGMQLLSREKSKIIRQWHWRKNLISMRWQGFKSQDHLLFSNRIEKSLLSGSFILLEKNKLITKIVINRLGRVRIEKKF